MKTKAERKIVPSPKKKKVSAHAGVGKEYEYSVGGVEADYPILPNFLTRNNGNKSRGWES
ncbi:hypothetical protein SK128_020882 [Halocaridina rubra]|uniref:Uncharacterized protein n=1 Tax=Halocaridina rubra TaxID=373956 RepID=A0AAN8XAW4_HALRR